MPITTRSERNNSIANKMAQQNQISFEPSMMYTQSASSVTDSSPQESLFESFGQSRSSRETSVDFGTVDPSSLGDFTLFDDNKKSNDNRQSSVEVKTEEKSGEKKEPKKRKSWGQQLPEPKTNLAPRKRAKTEDEKEQRRIERVLRNRRAAQTSRERKREEAENLEAERNHFKAYCDVLQQQLADSEAQVAQMKALLLKHGITPPAAITGAPITKKTVKFAPQESLLPTPPQQSIDSSPHLNAMSEMPASFAPIEHYALPPASNTNAYSNQYLQVPQQMHTPPSHTSPAMSPVSPIIQAMSPQAEADTTMPASPFRYANEASPSKPFPNPSDFASQMDANPSFLDLTTIEDLDQDVSATISTPCAANQPAPSLSDESQHSAAMLSGPQCPSFREGLFRLLSHMRTWTSPTTPSTPTTTLRISRTSSRSPRSQTPLISRVAVA